MSLIKSASVTAAKLIFNVKDHLDDLRHLESVVTNKISEIEADLEKPYAE